MVYNCTLVVDRQLKCHSGGSERMESKRNLVISDWVVISPMSDEGLKAADSISTQ